MINLANIKKALGNDFDNWSLYEEYQYCDKIHKNLGVLYLSIIDKYHPELMTAGASNLLERQRSRISILDDYTAEALHDVEKYQINKGKIIRDLYESDIVRAQTDVDLVFFDLKNLWKAAKNLSKNRDFRKPNITLVNGNPEDVYLCYETPSSEHFFDKPLSIELSLTPFFGNKSNIPYRKKIPNDPLITSLISICEEKIQRPYHARDVFDAYLIISELSKKRSNICEHLDNLMMDYQLIPEFKELMQRVNNVFPNSFDFSLLEQNRSGKNKQPKNYFYDRNDLYGLYVTDIESGDEENTKMFCRKNEKPILITPVGSFLLTEGDSVLASEIKESISYIKQKLAKM